MRVFAQNLYQRLPLRSAGAPSLVRIVNAQDPDDSSRYVAQVRLSPATFGSSMGTIGMDAIDSHKEIVNASKWLGDTSKKNLCEKLDAITVKAFYPEVWEDYSELDLDGLGYYEARRAIWLFNIKRNAALTNLRSQLRRFSFLMSVLSYARNCSHSTRRMTSESLSRCAYDGSRVSSSRRQAVSLHLHSATS